MLAFETFSALAARGSLVPVTNTLLADFETPVSVLSRVKDDENVFLLESVEAGERYGRFSFIGLNARRVFRVINGRAFLDESGRRRELAVPAGEPPLFALRALMRGVTPAVPEGLPPFIGGAVGAIGYETVGEFERIPAPKPAPAGAAPETTAMMLVDDLVIFDNLRHTVTLLAAVRTDEFDSLEAAYADGVRRVEAIRARLASAPVHPEAGVFPTPELVSNCTESSFCEMVREAKRRIVEGDIIQVVLSQKFSGSSTIPPLSLYRALRLISPSPYTFFMKMGETTLVSSSPETLCRAEPARDGGKEDGDAGERRLHALLRPIAGTRRRGGTPEKDAEHERELLENEKERAEHLMLVDLARNDLGRVAAPGSVRVPDFMRVQKFSHVMHIVSTVEGELARGKDAFELVRSAFPAGTLSGAPKVSAMRIIRDLEPEPRGLYGGAAGYFGYDGSMDLAITIRTIILRGERMEIQSGAGIVFDSDPKAEYEETRSKAAAMMRAIELAAKGLAL